MEVKPFYLPLLCLSGSRRHVCYNEQFRPVQQPRMSFYGSEMCFSGYVESLGLVVTGSLVLQTTLFDAYPANAHDNLRIPHPLS